MKKIIAILLTVFISNTLLAQVFETNNIMLSPTAAAPTTLNTKGTKLVCHELTIAAAVTEWNLNSDLEITCEKMTHLGAATSNIIKLKGNHTLTIFTKNGTTANIQFEVANTSTAIKYSKKPY